MTSFETKRYKRVQDDTGSQPGCSGERCYQGFKDIKSGRKAHFKGKAGKLAVIYPFGFAKKDTKLRHSICQALATCCSLHKIYIK